MSIDSCRRCGGWVDTDGDPECYVAHGRDQRGYVEYKCTCESCREQLSIEDEISKTEASAVISEAQTKGENYV